jgi:hypothetical protein
VSEQNHVGKRVALETPDGVVEYILEQDHFTIDPSHIDLELCNMGKVMLGYGEIETHLRLEVERKEAALDKYKADLDTKIRTDASIAGTKMTEGKVTAAITSDETRVALVESLATSRRHHNMMKWAMIALQSKRDCLIALAYRERQLMKAGEY